MDRRLAGIQTGATLGGKRRRADGTAGTASVKTPPVLGRIENLSLQERAYRALRDAILHGHFVPGQPLSIRSLAATFGASTQPIREALARLTAEGAIELLPNRMFRICLADADRIRELWHLRLLLEVDAARLAAARISGDDVQRLRSINQRKRNAAFEHFVEEMQAINTDWHFTIYRAAQSPLQQAVIEALWLRMAPIAAAATRHLLKHTGKERMLLRYIDDQESLIDALAAGDAQRAGNRLEALLVNSRRDFLALLDEGAFNVEP